MAALNFKQRLPYISTFIFDVDGVLTDDMVLTTAEGEQLRRMNTKDGYVLQLAVKKGYNIIIISGGTSESVRKRLNGLGIEKVNLACANKLKTYEKILDEEGLDAENILYMGDDLPDYPVMKKVGVACCPKDAATDIKNICHYISPKKGGEGCVRDVIEQVMRVQGKWMTKDGFEW